jgi:HK97 family phage prohead protease
METIHKTVGLRAEPGTTSRTLRFTISTGDRDRMGDTIDPAGWDLADWKQHPIILFGHDHSIPAIARGLDIGVVRGALKSTAEFPPEGLHPLADTVFGLAKNGFLTSASVGFAPIRWSFNDSGGRDFQEQRLLEWSIVNLPALPQAQLERALGARAAVERWLGQPSRQPSRDDAVVLDLDDDNVDIDRGTVVAVVKIVAPTLVRAEINRLRGRLPEPETLALDDEPVDLAPSEIRAAIREGLGPLIRAELRRARGRID